jgi:Family of unknown function (DUF6516)
MAASTDPAEYLKAAQLALIESPVIREFTIVQQWAHSDDGFLRVRAALVNGDFLEAAEYFVRQGDQLVTQDYRHHWADSSGESLRRRWDSSPHHPKVSTFPHHCHVGSEDNV